MKIQLSFLFALAEIEFSSASKIIPVFKKYAMIKFICSFIIQAQLINQLNINRIVDYHVMK